MRTLDIISSKEFYKEKLRMEYSGPLIRARTRANIVHRTKMSSLSYSICKITFTSKHSFMWTEFFYSVKIGKNSSLVHHGKYEIESFGHSLYWVSKGNEWVCWYLSEKPRIWLALLLVSFFVHPTFIPSDVKSKLFIGCDK